MPSPYDNLRFSQSQFIPQYHGAPVEEFKNLLQKRETDYNLNQDRLDVISSALSASKVRNEDIGVRQNLIDKANTYIKSIAEKGNAYEFEGTNMRNFAREVLNDEKFIIAQERYAQDEATKADLKKRRAAGQVSEEGFWLEMNSLNNEYSGLGEKNEAGFYNSPDYYSAMPNRNIETEIQRRIKAVMPIIKGGTWKEDSRIGNIPGMSKMNSSEIEAAAIEKAIRNLLGEGDNAAFLNERAEYNAKVGNEELDSREKIIDKYVESYKSSSGILGKDEDYRFLPTVTDNSAEIRAAEEAAKAFEDTGVNVEIKSPTNKDYASYEENLGELESIEVKRQEVRDAFVTTNSEITTLNQRLSELTKNNPQADTPEIIQIKEDLTYATDKLNNQIFEIETLTEREEQIENYQTAAEEQTAAELNMSVEQLRIGVTENEESILEAKEEEKQRFLIGLSLGTIPTDNMTKEEIKKMNNEFATTRSASIYEGEESFKKRREIEEKYANLYANRNYASKVKNVYSKTLEKNLEEITRGKVIDQPIISIKEDKYSDITNQILQNEGIVSTGKLGGISVALGGVNFQVTGYQTNNMEDYSPEQQNALGEFGIMGFTVRNENLAFVARGYSESSDDNKERNRTVTFGDQAKTNAWIRKYPELEAPYVSMEALEKSMRAIGSKVPFKLSKIDPNNNSELIVELEEANPEASNTGGKEIVKTVFAIKPFVTSKLIDGIYVHTISFEGRILESDDETIFKNQIIPPQQINYLLKSKFGVNPKSMSRLTQRGVTDVMENLKQVLKDNI